MLLNTGGGTLNTGGYVPNMLSVHSIQQSPVIADFTMVVDNTVTLNLANLLSTQSTRSVEFHIIPNLGDFEIFFRDDGYYSR